MTLPFKRSQVIHHPAAKERRAILKRRLINHHRRPLRLNTLHHALNRTLTEIITVRLHSQTIHTHNTLTLHRPIVRWQKSDGVKLIYGFRACLAAGISLRSEVNEFCPVFCVINGTFYYLCSLNIMIL